MYELTPRMLQTLDELLRQYHNPVTGFTRDRIKGEQLEELLVKAIQSDDKAGHHAVFAKGKHEKGFDIKVTPPGLPECLIQIKSGFWDRRPGFLGLSGPRLGRFMGNASRDNNISDLTDYINNPESEMMSLASKTEDGDRGLIFNYQMCLVPIERMGGLNPNDWLSRYAEGSGKEVITQTNSHGVIFEVSESLSWQLWWYVPVGIITRLEPFSIGRRVGSPEPNLFQ